MAHTSVGGVEEEEEDEVGVGGGAGAKNSRVICK